jgi:phage repressor protein C with HTH and peptisase S24 domain
MKQEDVWRGIDLLADEVGVTPARLARMAGLDQAVFSAGRRRRADGSLRWPSMDSIAKVLKVAEISMGDFVNYMHGDPGTRAAFNLPSLPMTEADDPARYDADGYPAGPTWDRIEFPDLQDPRCFGLVLDSNAYAPMYREGDMLVCAPGVSVRRGDRVVYRRKGAGLAIGVLVRQSPFTIDMASLDGQETETFPAQDIEWITRIAWARQ